MPNGDGIYENSYVKEAGTWKIASLHLYVNFLVPYEKGWARLKPAEGLVQSETSRTFPPDRGPTAEYKPFPATQVPPFQAPHPVTGEAERSALMKTINRVLQLCCMAFAGLWMVVTSHAALAQASPEARLEAYRERVARLETRMRSKICKPLSVFFDKGLWEEAADLFTATAVSNMDRVASTRQIGSARDAATGPEGLAQVT